MLPSLVYSCDLTLSRKPREGQDWRLDMTMKLESCTNCSPCWRGFRELWEKTPQKEWIEPSVNFTQISYKQNSDTSLKVYIIFPNFPTNTLRVHLITTWPVALPSIPPVISLARSLLGRIVTVNTGQKTPLWSQLQIESWRHGNIFLETTVHSALNATFLWDQKDWWSLS